MHTDSELIRIIRGMMEPGLPVGLHVLKASVMTDDRSRVETIVEDMVNAGEIVEIKKNRFKKRERQ